MEKEQDKSKVSAGSVLFNIYEVLKAEADAKKLECKEHEVPDESCPTCKATKKARRQTIADKMLFANQLFGIGLREYIRNLKI